MRITNKIMQRNNLTNINTNKVLEDKLTSQLSTEKKITRPSDDPVIAIRALRLRNNVTQVTQYYDKNSKDAESWLKVTSDALDCLTGVVTDMYKQCETGANGDLTHTDRKTILTQLQAFADQVYKTGDADYAGRYVFTGYRTDTPLSFQEKTKRQYEITEQVDKGLIDSVTYVNTDKLFDWTAVNYSTNSDVSGITEQDITKATVYRMRLAYNSLDTEAADGSTLDPAIDVEYTLNGTAKKLSDDYTIETRSSKDEDPDPYTYVAGNDKAVVLVPETGELLLGADVYNILMTTKDDTTTGTRDEGEIRISYQKTNWASTDLRPEHYFYCTAKDFGPDGTLDSGSAIVYNKTYLDSTQERQPIEYDVGFNTTLRVNSTADECFNLGIVREVDDLVKSMQQVVDLEDLKDQMEAKIVATSNTADLEILNKQLDAVEKALTYAKDVCQKRFEQGMTAMQGFLDDANLAITNNGTRGAKLELIQSRLENQKTTFETLQSENEDVDITEVAINLSSASVTYEAALMATSKIMQNTLLNYI